MATLRNQGKLAALNKENCEEPSRSNLAQNSNAPRSQEDFMTQASDENEGRVTNKLSQEIKRTFTRAIPSGRLSSEPATSGPLRNRSGEVPKRIRHGPIKESGRLPE